MGRFYKNGHLYDTGIFSGKKALLSLTTGGPSDDYLEGGLNGNLNGILRPIHRGIFQFVGFTVLQPQVVYGPVRKTPEELSEELEKWKKRLEGIFDEEPVSVGMY
jgi:putative NADPH-quinone reductase